MTEKARKYLSDIEIAIDLIEDFMRDINDYNEYEADLKTQSAIERQLGIIGEAVNKFKKESPNIEFINTKQIVGFRNRLIHAYDSVDNSIVWVIIKKYLSPLKSEIAIISKNS